ncbi:MAG: alpha/beta hydrolase [Alphaproteobacteria bacterium]|nr:alpha/beta hydrolase [Alphaproteobacteria bacterium]MCB9930343.1 alpha/beta hydrolase [Alphaproteobacteria bacterium]
MSQDQLDKLVALLRERPQPEPKTVEAMRDRINELGDKMPPPPEAVVETVTVAGCAAEWVSAPGANPNRQVLYLHGGGYVIGSPHSHRNLAYNISKAIDGRCLVVDYRMGPEDPFPAAVEDAVAAWQWMLDQGGNPARMAIMGDSAGGGLTIATQVALRDRGLRLPACSVPISPWTDLEGSGETIKSKAAEDPMVAEEGLHWFADLYRAGADVRDPLVSPLYADLSGLPPMLIQVGSAEILLSDATRVADKAKSAGVDVTLEVWERMPHVWHLFQPMLSEAGDAIAKLGAWARERTA